jgi:hypothetical protein
VVGEGGGEEFQLRGDERPEHGEEARIQLGRIPDQEQARRVQHLPSPHIWSVATSTAPSQYRLLPYLEDDEVVEIAIGGGLRLLLAVARGVILVRACVPYPSSVSSGREGREGRERKKKELCYRDS